MTSRSVVGIARSVYVLVLAQITSRKAGLKLRVGEGETRNVEHSLDPLLNVGSGQWAVVKGLGYKCHWESYEDFF